MATKTANFESNDLSEFDSTVTDSGDLSTSAAAAMQSTSYGMQVVIDDATAIYGQWTFANKSEIRFRFYLDINSLAMADRDEFTFCQDSRGPNDFQVRIHYRNATGYQMRAGTYDGESWNYTPYETFTDAEHWFEIHCKRGNGDGFVKLYKDTLAGVAQENTGLDDDGCDFDDFRIGMTSGCDASTSGTVYFDLIELNDDGSAIGAYTPADGPGCCNVIHSLLEAIRRR